MDTIKQLPLKEEIIKVEEEILSTTLQLDMLKAKLKALQHRQSMQLGIKWIDEIRKVLVTDNKYRAVTIGAILFNIQVQYGIKPDRNIKNKIATTLSRLYKEGKICKSEDKNQILYGYPEAFEKDCITIKEGVSKVLI